MNSRIYKLNIGIILKITILIIITNINTNYIFAEENGSGHYAPGLNSSFIDALPGKQGLAAANYFCYYKGDSDIGSTIPFGIGLTAGINATVYSDTILFLYQPGINVFGGYYVFGVGIPYVWTTVKGYVQLKNPAGGTIISKERRDTANGLGDIALYPVILGGNSLNGDLKYDFRFAIYAPTGEYDKNDLANVGKNFWTFEPGLMISYLSHKTGFEISSFAGIDFNTINSDTEYQSGDQLHIDVTLAEHLPALGGFFGIGVNGFYYKQITGDSGSGAILGGFEGYTTGVGPVLSYAAKLWGKDIAAEVKWLPEVDVERRTQGDYVWFKLVAKF